ncbi:MAG: hypothetical protein AB7L71_17515 [Vicinamibacterales bacterium]
MTLHFDGETVHHLGNQISIVLGFTDVLLLECDADHPFHAELHEIRSAAQKAAALLARAAPGDEAGRPPGGRG